ncbi:MAG: periplasmic heavy metal sensor [Candidatus Omnitrophica bacterium]|nr:periplasmic heavy metal sensor [Candidatus Omnitrophota bacterium]
MTAKTKIAGCMAVFMALSVPVVFAQGAMGPKDSWHHEEGQWHHPDMEKMMGKILNLTGAQEKQLEGIHQRQRETMKKAIEQIKSNRQAFEAEIVKAAPDMNKVNSLQTQFKTIQSQLLDEHLNSILAVKKVLTPEQFAGYMALKKERQIMVMHRMHESFEHKGWMGKGGEHKQWSDRDQDND